MTLRDQIIQHALTLPAEDRKFVVDVLEGSLPVGEFRTVEMADAWSQEIDRRISAYDRGETMTIDFDTALNNMHQALEAHRGQK